MKMAYIIRKALPLNNGPHKIIYNTHLTSLSHSASIQRRMWWVLRGILELRVKGFTPLPITMKILIENVKKKLAVLQPVLPYGVIESWDDLNPRLYHAVHIYWLKFYGMWYNNSSPKSIFFWLQIIYTAIVLWLVCFLPGIGEVVYLLKRRENIGDVAEG